MTLSDWIPVLGAVVGGGAVSAIAAVLTYQLNKRKSIVETEKLKIRNDQNRNNPVIDETFAESVARSTDNANKKRYEMFKKKVTFSWAMIDGEEVFTND